VTVFQIVIVKGETLFAGFVQPVSEGAVFGSTVTARAGRGVFAANSGFGSSLLIQSGAYALGAEAFALGKAL